LSEVSEPKTIALAEESQVEGGSLSIVEVGAELPEDQEPEKPQLGDKKALLVSIFFVVVGCIGLGTYISGNDIFGNGEEKVFVQPNENIKLVVEDESVRDKDLVNSGQKDVEISGLGLPEVGYRPQSVQSRFIDQNSESLIEQVGGINKAIIAENVARTVGQRSLPEPFQTVEPLADVSDDEEESAKEKATLKEKAAELAKMKKEERQAEILKAQNPKKEIVRDEVINKTSSGKKEVASTQNDTSTCAVVDAPFAQTLLSKATDVRNGNIPAYWKAINKTNKTVAIVVKQDKKNVAVAYLSPNSSLGSRIPATHLKFDIKFGDGCVNWKSDGGISSELPLEVGNGARGKETSLSSKEVTVDRAKNSDSPKVKKGKEDFYRLAIFVTTIEKSGDGFEAVSKLSGHASK
jgi:hypothetical protein